MESEEEEECSYRAATTKNTNVPAMPIAIPVSVQKEFARRRHHMQLAQQEQRHEGTTQSSSLSLPAAAAVIHQQQQNGNSMPEEHKQQQQQLQRPDSGFADDLIMPLELQQSIYDNNFPTPVLSTHNMGCHLSFSTAILHHHHGQTEAATARSVNSIGGSSCCSSSTSFINNNNNSNQQDLANSDGSCSSSEDALFSSAYGSSSCASSLYYSLGGQSLQSGAGALFTTLDANGGFIRRQSYGQSTTGTGSIASSTYFSTTNSYIEVPNEICCNNKSLLHITYGQNDDDEEEEEEQTMMADAPSKKVR